jgi:chromosomal replication initiation ATPase DnaA
MSQLIFKFPFKTTYYENDFYVSSNNFTAYKLIENCPNWLDSNINIFGEKGCGKTHLANILKKKINSILIKPNELNESILTKFKNIKCLIIDDYDNDIEEKLLYTILNFTKQSNKYIVINSLQPIKKNLISLKDLKSRFDSFLDVGIDLPTDDLIRVILVKSLSDKQINVDIKLLEYILKNIERSYAKIFQFIKDIDIESLSTGKSININLIKKVLNK